MDKKEDLKLSEGSRYKIISIGGRDSCLETEGIFKGYATIGIEEAGLVIEQSAQEGTAQKKLRIIPLHAILAIDILDVKIHESNNEKDLSDLYYG
jgi:hypothetical protein